MKVFPNPTNGVLNIDYTENSNVLVFNVIGELVMRSTHFDKNHQMDIQHLKAGVYMIRLEFENGTYYSSRVIKL